MQRLLILLILAALPAAPTEPSLGPPPAALEIVESDEVRETPIAGGILTELDAEVDVSLPATPATLPPADAPAAKSTAATVGHPDEARRAVECGAAGIGLFRTEFLFLDRKTAPNEDEQLAAYRSTLDTMSPP